MATTTERFKRFIIGRALQTEQAERRLGRGRGIGALASDAISSNVYATQEILIFLAIGGFGLYRYGPWIAAAVVIVFAVIVAAYRQVVRQYPGGGADYEVAAKNIGPRTAALVGAAMLIDFALTLAVSVVAILDTAVSLVPRISERQVLWAIGLVALMTVLSLRGPSGLAGLLRMGTYAFVVAVVAMAGFAVVQVLLGETPRAASSQFELAEPAAAVSGLALLLVLSRAFSSGSIAVTGVEAIGVGVPRFRKPRGEHAAATLVVLATVSMLLFASITALALLTGVRVVADSDQLAGQAAGMVQQTVLVQIADAVFSTPIGVWAVAAATVLVLLAAGLSAFRSFSALSSVIARDGMLPRQFMARGDRLVHSNGIVLLGIAAGVLIWALGASLTGLIQLYVVGVFLALALGQFGMVRHWNRVLLRPGNRTLSAPQVRGARRARLIAAVAAATAAIVLAVVLLSKVASGAWIVLVLVPVLAAGMMATKRHYDAVFYEMAPTQARSEPAHDVSALILVARIHKPTMRAVAYARATRPSTIEAVTVAVDEVEAQRLAQEWRDRGLTVPLRVLDSSFREINTPILTYVRQLRQDSPDTLLTVYIPEYVVTHWWEELLHNQSAARLKRRLMALSNVVVISVPWQLSAGTDPVPPRPGEAGVPKGPSGITGLTGALPRVERNDLPQ